MTFFLSCVALWLIVENANLCWAIYQVDLMSSLARDLQESDRAPFSQQET